MQNNYMKTINFDMEDHDIKKRLAIAYGMMNSKSEFNTISILFIN